MYRRLRWRLRRYTKGPLYIVNNPLSRVEDFAQEARAEYPLYHYWGITQAALGHRDVMRRRYIRQRQFSAVTDWKMRVLGVGVPVGFLLIAATGMYWFMGGDLWIVEGRDVSEMRGVAKRNPLWTAFLSLVVGVFSIVIPAMTSFELHKFNFAYARVFVFEFLDKNDPTKITSAMTHQMPRLCFADKMHLGDYYYGPSARSGMLEAEIHLQMPVGEPLYKIRYQHQLYDLEPAVHTYTGSAADEGYRLLARAANIGEMRANLNPNELMDFMRDNYALFIVGGSFLALIYIFSELQNIR